MNEEIDEDVRNSPTIENLQGEPTNTVEVLFKVPQENIQNI